MAGQPIFRKPSIKVFKTMSKKSNVLILPDAHLNYEHPKALEFAIATKELFDIPDENIFQLGDLEDNFWAGQYPKGSDFPHTPNQELEITREKIKEWGKAFPLLKICHSNHQSRFYRKAAGGELPSQVLRNYRELFEYPKTWDVQECFVVNTKKQFMLTHGEELGSGPGAMTRAINLYGISTAYGHLHSAAGVLHLNTTTQDLWAMNCGCLIDPTQYCFQYAKHARLKPSLGVGVVLNSGTTPIFIPMPI